MVRHVMIFKDWPVILILAAASVGTSIVAFHMQYGYLKFLNVVAWTVLAIYLFKDIFGLVNLLDMSNDLYLWLLRIAGAIVAPVGLFFGGTFFFAAMVANADPFTTGVSILFTGLGCLGLFMMFRTRRRYGHLYVNR